MLKCVKGKYLYHATYRIYVSEVHILKVVFCLHTCIHTYANHEKGDHDALLNILKRTIIQKFIAIRLERHIQLLGSASITPIGLQGELRHSNRQGFIKCYIYYL